MLYRPNRQSLTRSDLVLAPPVGYTSEIRPSRQCHLALVLSALLTTRRAQPRPPFPPRVCSYSLLFAPIRSYSLVFACSSLDSAHLVLFSPHTPLACSNSLIRVPPRHTPAGRLLPSIPLATGAPFSGPREPALVSLAAV
ncbi:hypothetical protein RHS03_08605, partial [Rhizoctonia solani]